MNRLDPVAFVIDRPNARYVVGELTKLRGMWREMLEIWIRSDLPYLILLAHTNDRIRKGAPLTFMAANNDALRDAMKSACHQLNDCKCQWTLILEAGSEGKAIVQREILKDAVVGGSA